MNRVTHILDKLSTKSREDKVLFYERLGFNMTICIRSIGSDPRTTDAEKIEAIRTINELSHRIFNWTWKLRNTDLEFVDADCFGAMKSYAELNNIVAGEIGAALNSYYRAIDL